MNRIKELVFFALLVAVTTFAPLAQALAADQALTVAIPRGVWGAAPVELGMKAGIFQKHGLDLKLEYLKDSAAVRETVTSKGADIGLPIDAMQAMRDYGLGAAIRIIGASMAGSTDYWYVLGSSPIKSVREIDGKKVAYEANGTTSHYDAIDLFKYLNRRVNLVPTGNAPETLDQLKAGRIDVGWASAPFGAAEIESGAIRIIARANEAPRLRDKTTSVIITNADALQNRRDALTRFLEAYRETIDWMYKDPAAVQRYADLAGLPAPAAQRLRDEFYPKTLLYPDRLLSLRAIMKEAVAQRYLRKKLSRRELRQLVQIPSALPSQDCELKGACPVGFIAP